MTADARIVLMLDEAAGAIFFRRAAAVTFGLGSAITSAVEALELWKALPAPRTEGTNVRKLWGNERPNGKAIYYRANWAGAVLHAFHFGRHRRRLQNVTHSSYHEQTSQKRYDRDRDH